MKVTLLIPCLNEARFLPGVLDNILSQDYPHTDMEVFILDGGSTDGSVDIIRRFSAQYPWIQHLPNPDRYVPHAMNLGIRQATGDIIIRMDAHAAYPPFYVSRLVRWSVETGAENVGGTWITRPRSETPRARAIAAVLSHPLGVGNARFRLGISEPTEVDTVPFGCYPRRVFDQYGFYDTRLIRNQDIELNSRIRRLGGRILLVPDVHCTYFARDTFQSLWKNNYANGRWVWRTARYSGRLSSLSIRHFIPMGFALYLILWVLCLVFQFFPLLASIPGLIYFQLITLVSFQVALVREKDKRLIPEVWTSFSLLHLSYGLGSLVGFIRP